MRRLTALSVVLGIAAVTRATEPVVPEPNLAAGQAPLPSVPLLSLGASPELPAFQAGLEAFVAKLARPAEGTAPPGVVIVDDMRPYARLVQDGEASRFVVSLGLLRFVRDDDELAYVLSQELEKPASQLKELAAQIEGDKDRQRDPQLLNRLVDSESDVKAVLGRVIENGYNPHAAYAFMTRVRERYGDAQSGASLWSQRRDAIGLAISYWTREQGRQNVDRLGEGVSSRELLAPLQAGLLVSAQARLERAGAMARIVREPAHSAAPLYERAVSGAVDSSEKSKEPFRYGYVTDFWNNWQELRRLGADELGPEARLGLQLALHRGLDGAWESARAEKVPQDYATGERDRLEALLALDWRRYRLSSADPREARRELRWKHKDWRHAERALAREADERRREEIRLHAAESREEFERAEENYALARRAFAEPPAVVDRGLDRVLERRGADAWRQYWPDYLAGSGLTVRRLQAAIERGARRRLETFRRHFPLLVSVEQGIRRFAGGFHDPGNDAMGWLLELKPDTAELGVALEVFAELAARRLAESGPDDPRRHKAIDDLGAVHFHGRDDGTTAWTLLGRYAEAEPAKAAAIAARVAGSVVAWSTYGGELCAFIELLKREKLPAPVRAALRDALSPALQARLDVELEWNPWGALDAFQSAEWMLDPDQDREPFSPERRAAVLSAVLARIARTDSTEARRQALTAALKVRFPWLFLTASERKSRQTLDALIPPLREAASEEATRSNWGRILPYQYVLSLFYDKTAPRRFFALVADLKALIHFDYRNPDAKDDDGDGYRRPPPDPNEGMHRRFMLWLRRHQPDDLALMATIGDFGGDKRTGAAYVRALRSYFDRRVAQARGEGLADPLSAAARAFWSAWEQARFFPINNARLSAFVASLVPEKREARLEFFVSYMEGVDAYVRDMLARSARNYSASDSDWELRAPMAQVKEAAADPAALAAASDALLARAYAAVVTAEVNRADPVYDKIFEALWRRPKGPGAALKTLSGDAAVRALYFDDNKLALAQAQLEAAFPLDAVARAGARAGHGLVRPELAALLERVKNQFPDHAPARERMLDWIERRLVTTRAETALISALRLNKDNWKGVRGVENLDEPQRTNRYLSNNAERYDLLNYLTEDGAAMPNIPSLMHSWDMGSGEMELLKIKRLYREFSLPVRVYLLQPLLDEQSGLLADPAMERRLLDRVLGPRALEPVTRAMLEAYLRRLPVAEKKAILAHLLASRLGRGEGRASLKAVLEAMGPLGIKAGQFLRTSGALPREERDQLDDFLDQALPPTRKEIYEALEKAFGPMLDGLAWVGDLLGSGSLNFIVEAGVVDPETGQVVRVAVRLLREAAAGQAANENEVWTKAAADLMASSDPAVRRAGRLAEEARAQAWSTLGPDGAEVDLSVERGLEGKAALAYASGAQDGLSVVVARHLPRLQERWVARERSRQVSIYELVEHVPHKALGFEEKSRVARRILRAELSALFRKGVFDPDGHPGNWLYSRLRALLVRVDYSQLREMGAPKREALREITAALLRPSPDRTMRRILAGRLSDAFEVEGGLPSSAAADLEAALADPGLPAFDAPHERLLFLQEKLESRWRRERPDAVVRLTPELRAEVASLAKLSLYRETVGDRAYLTELLDAVGLPRWRFAWLYLKRRLVR